MRTRLSEDLQYRGLALQALAVVAAFYEVGGQSDYTTAGPTDEDIVDREAGLARARSAGVHVLGGGRLDDPEVQMALRVAVKRQASIAHTFKDYGDADVATYLRLQGEHFARLARRLKTQGDQP